MGMVWYDKYRPSQSMLWYGMLGYIYSLVPYKGNFIVWYGIIAIIEAWYLRIRNGMVKYAIP